MTIDKQVKNGINWKVILQEIYNERREAVANKINNKSDAHEWIREKLIPAFRELVVELPQVNGIESVVYNANGRDPNNTLKFKFQGTSLQYSINLLVSSKDVTGRISFMAGNATPSSEDIPSIIKWGKQEIINNFLTAHETWEIL